MLDSTLRGKVDVYSRDSGQGDYVFWSTGDINGIASTTEFKQDGVRPALGNCAEERAQGYIQDGGYDRYDMTGQFCEIYLVPPIGGAVTLERTV